MDSGEARYIVQHGDAEVKKMKSENERYGIGVHVDHKVV
jgi:hypothetical protein